MKTEFEPQDIERIALQVRELIKPLLTCNHTAVDELLTVDELAMFLKTSKAQVYQWVNQSQHGLSTFPYLKSGRLLRFSKNEIMTWLKNNTGRLEKR
ncbi:MAG: helix-turn-helix domain-containing protein [Deltaproteobacteria bacterium]|nr:helix-turn-helix domain-containing protein [Deltaproteobacteria bacterium]